MDSICTQIFQGFHKTNLNSLNFNQKQLAPYTVYFDTGTLLVKSWRCSEFKKPFSAAPKWKVRGYCEQWCQNGCLHCFKITVALYFYLYFRFIFFKTVLREHFHLSPNGFRHRGLERTIKFTHTKIYGHHFLRTRKWSTKGILWFAESGSLWNEATQQLQSNSQ